MTFLIGSIIYIVLHAVLFHYLKSPGQLRWHMVLIFISDAIAMATLYKMYYGRSIVHELLENQDGWEYNADTHEYRRKNERPEGEGDVDRGNFVDVGDINRVVVDQEAGEDAENVCSVCLVNVQNTMLAPCRHVSTCFSCALDLDKCPVCMQGGITRIPVYHA